MDWLDVDTNRLRQLQTDAEEAVQLCDDNARLTKILELQGVGSIDVAFGCTSLNEPHQFWPLVGGTRVPGVSYDTHIAALEAAFKVWEKGSKNGH